MNASEVVAAVVLCEGHVEMSGKLEVGSGARAALACLQELHVRAKSDQFIRKICHVELFGSIKLLCLSANVCKRLIGQLPGILV